MLGNSTHCEARLRRWPRVWRRRIWTRPKRRILGDAFARLTGASNSNDARAVTDADLALHKTIVALSGHRRLADQYALVEQQVRMYIASTNARLRRRQLVVQEHKGLVSAISNGNGDE